MKIRALTIHIDPNTIKEKLSHYLEELISNINEASSKFNLKIWTIRLAITPQTLNNTITFANKLEKTIPNEINYITIPLKIKSNDSSQDIYNLIEQNKRIFISITGGINELMKFKDLLIHIKEKQNYELFIKTAFSIPKHIITPYFPSATAIENENGISAALLYINDLINANSIENEIIKCYTNANQLLSQISSKFKIKNYGIDLSLSPWMNESIANLIEKYGKIKFNKPGTHHAIYKLNNEIRNIIVKYGLNVIGFNEVMLPYAEDNKLMELGGKGELTVYDLISYASICVAGIDLPIIPSLNENEIEKLIKDIYSILKVKNKPSGIRLILTSLKPSEIADLGFIGKAPVMKLK